jgi:hypothetical protein
MKMKFRTIPFIACALVCSILACSAQPSGEPVIKVKFRIISWDRVIDDLFFLSGKGEVKPVLALPNARSPFYEYEGTGPVVFGRQKTGPDGKPVFEAAASVPIREFGERTLLLFSDKAGDPGRFQVAGFDDSDSALPAGSYRFCNFTPNLLAVKCGDASGTVPPRESLLLRAKTIDSAEIMPVEIYAKTEKGSQRAYANRWPYGATTRTLVFISYLPETKNFEIKKLHEDASSIPTPTPKP